MNTNPLLDSGTPVPTSALSGARSTIPPRAAGFSNAVFSNSAVGRFMLKMTIAFAVLTGFVPRGQASMDLWPRNGTVEAGGAKQFGAYVPISPNTIAWLVNDIVGGNASVGTVSPTGLYQSPTQPPMDNVVTIKAQSTVLPAQFASTSLSIIRPYPWLWSTYPSKIQAGSYSVSFNGNNFAPDSQAQANGVDVSTTYVSKTKLIVTGTAGSAGTITFAVRQPGPGSVTGNSVSVPIIVPTVTATVSPSSATVPLGGTRTFTATVVGSGNNVVYWSVNGGSSNGEINSSGLYMAPPSMPPSSTVTIRATSTAAPLAFAEAVVTLTQPPVSVFVSPTAATVALGDSRKFHTTVTGTLNAAVAWSVSGGNANGVITTDGTYTAPANMPASPFVVVRATSVTDPSSFNDATVTLVAAPDYTALLTAGRFLEQASFGPTSDSIALVQQIGIDAYLDAQFAMPASAIPPPSDNSMHSLRQWVLYNYTAAPDQLRQRIVYALSQIIVTSANKLIYADEILPWMNVLSQHAFGNYRDLLRDITLSPSMGKYLDLANSVKPGNGGGANENYARELMQLFTIGLWELNSDGSFATDGNGIPVLTYNQNTVAQVALALTGWTYATAPGAAPRSLNWEYFGAPMESRQQHHDLSAKHFFGCTLPAGQTVEQDLDDLLDCLMNHPNTAPFIATRLIRSLVTSNPGPDYIARTAAVFADNGAGVQGDLQAVIRAILTDPEARNDMPTAASGRLKEPILNIAGLLRALDGQFTSTQQLSYLFDSMAQSPLTPPSVFSWFSPLYHVPKSPLFGPEFQIYTPTEAALRGNLFYRLLHSPGSDMIVDLSPFQAYGNDLPALVELVNQRLLYGRMPSGMKQVLIEAAAPGYDSLTRIETVLYLTALSGQYAVQH